MVDNNLIKLIDETKIIYLLKSYMLDEFKLEITYNTSVFMTNYKFIKSKCNIRVVTSEYEILIGYGKLSGKEDYDVYSICNLILGQLYKTMIDSVKDYLIDVYRK